MTIKSQMNELHIRYGNEPSICLILYKIKGIERRSDVDAFSEYTAKLEQFSIYKQKDNFDRDLLPIEEKVLVPRKIQDDVISAFLNNELILASVFNSNDGAKCLTSIIQLKKPEIIETNDYFNAQSN